MPWRTSLVTLWNCDHNKVKVDEMDTLKTSTGLKCQNATKNALQRTGCQFPFSTKQKHQWVTKRYRSEKNRHPCRIKIHCRRQSIHHSIPGSGQNARRHGTDFKRLSEIDLWRKGMSHWRFLCGEKRWKRWGVEYRRFSCSSSSGWAAAPADPLRQGAVTVA